MLSQKPNKPNSADLLNWNILTAQLFVMQFGHIIIQYGGI